MGVGATHLLGRRFWIGTDDFGGRGTSRVSRHAIELTEHEVPLVDGVEEWHAGSDALIGRGHALGHGFGPALRTLPFAATPADSGRPLTLGVSSTARTDCPVLESGDRDPMRRTERTEPRLSEVRGE